MKKKRWYHEYGSYHHVQVCPACGSHKSHVGNSICFNCGEEAVEHGYSAGWPTFIAREVYNSWSMFPGTLWYELRNGTQVHTNKDALKAIGYKS